MSGRGSRFKKSDSSVFGKVIEGAIEDTSKLLNAVDFIESPQGLNVELYPLQRLIVKCIFAVPFDYKPIQIPMWDVFREKLLRRVSEQECLHILHEEGRCNVSDWRDIPERGFNEAAIFAGRRGGKALSLDTCIPTPSGFVRNSELHKGDMVLSPSGRPVEVLQAHEPFWSKTYRVTFDDGTSVVVHPDHLWVTYTKSDRRKLLRRPATFLVDKGKCHCGCGNKAASGHKFKHGHHKLEEVKGVVRTTEDIRNTLHTLKSKQQANHSVQLTKAIELEHRELPLDPYCLGVWLGDGNSDCGIITATDEDGTQILNYFTEAGYEWRKSSLEDYRWHVYDLPLTKLGVLKNKHIPHDYLWASYEQRLALLQGLMDTDGCCSRKRCEFTNTNRRLAEGVYQLASSLGLKPYWGEGRASLQGRDCGEKYRVTWTATLPVFRLPRKLAQLPRSVKDTQNWRYIVSIEPDEDQMVRCITVANEDGLFLFGENFNVTHNSQVVSAIGAYKLYMLLNLRSPQTFFDIISGSHIDFTFMAQDDTGASRLYDKLREDINRAPFFNPYLKDSSSSWMGFVSEQDRLKRDVTPSINVASYPCTTNASRGPSNIFLALDEFAFFRSAKGSSSDEVYGAATPSTINFKHAERNSDGNWIPKKIFEAMVPEEYTMYQDSLILSISSPWTKVGKMYDIHRSALERGAASGIFTIRVSTAEMNPTVLSKTLRGEYEKNPLTFKAEYGGQFLESSESYLKEAEIRACTDVQYKEISVGYDEPDESTARLNLSRFHPSAIGRQYFWAIDLGMSNDATAVAIGHLEYKGGAQPIHLVYDYIDRMMVGEKFEGPGVTSQFGIEKYIGYKNLPLEDILAWLKALNELMPCFRGATDQHGGQQLVQLLELNKIYNIELVNLTATLNSQMAYILQGYVRDGRCRFPYVPKFLKELRMVEAEYINKYQIRVQAPMEKGSHDDMVDAAQLCAYKAQKWLMDEGGLKIDPSGQSLLMSERLNQPAGAITSLDGVMMRDLQVLERMKKIQAGMDNFGNAAVRNPFHRRGRG